MKYPKLKSMLQCTKGKYECLEELQLYAWRLQLKAYRVLEIKKRHVLTYTNMKYKRYQTNNKAFFDGLVEEE